MNTYICPETETDRETDKIYTKKTTQPAKVPNAHASSES